MATTYSPEACATVLANRADYLFTSDILLDGDTSTFLSALSDWIRNSTFRIPDPTSADELAQTFTEPGTMDANKPEFQTVVPDLVEGVKRSKAFCAVLEKVRASQGSD